MTGGALPADIRSVLPLSGFRLLTSGLRASERPPCEGACPPLALTLTLVDGAGDLCWTVSLPDEHRLGPVVARPGATIFVAGSRRVYALSFQGQRLVTTVAEGLRPEPVALADGGAAFLDGEGHLGVFRPSGALRYRRRLPLAAGPLALASRPGGGVLVAFRAEVRGHDPDGVPVKEWSLKEGGAPTGLAETTTGELWVWSPGGAYRYQADGTLAQRLPTRAPADGQLYAATLSPEGIFHALISEQGYHPVKLLALGARGASEWFRPYTGAQPSRCRLLPGALLGRGGWFAVLCEGEPRGRVVLWDAAGLSVLDEEVRRPQLAFARGGSFALAEDEQGKDMTEGCRLRFFGAAGRSLHTTWQRGPCPPLWSDASFQVYLGRAKVK